MAGESGISHQAVRRTPSGLNRLYNRTWLVLCLENYRRSFFLKGASPQGQVELKVGYRLDASALNMIDSVAQEN
jgi:hypothetical protein